MDEYIEQLLAEMTDNRTLKTVVQNILDEPIPEAVKKRLLKPLLPAPIPPTRKRKLEKRKLVLQEFDPLHDKTNPKLGVKPIELISLVTNQNIAEPPQYVLLQEVDAGALRDYGADLSVGHHLEADALAFLNAMTPNTTAVIEKELNRLGGLKFTLVLTVVLQKLLSSAGDTAESDRITTIAYFRSNSAPVLNPSEIIQKLAESRAKIMESLEAFTNEGSGWHLKRCEDLLLGIVRYKPFRGRSYIKTPAYVPPRTVINVKNQDNRCFEWAILSALFPVAHGEHPDRPASYQTERGVLNFTGISFPVKVTDITKFERQNPRLSVSVFGWKSGLYPLHVSKQEGQAIDLLLIIDNEDPGKTHYVWIKDLTRMLFKNSNCKMRKHPCRRCLHVFSSEALLETHKNDCQGIGEKPQRTVMPENGKNILKFTNHHKQMRVPFIIYADFESLKIPVE